MCSQYELVVPVSKIIADTRITLDDNVFNLTWDKHVFPYAKAPVITKYNNQNSLRLMSYSMVPYWSKTAKPNFTTYNARLDRPAKQSDKLELIYETPTWRQPFKSQRCVVPISGFFESCREGTHAGNIVKFSSQNETDLLFAAGVYDRWTDHNTGEVIDSFAILTDDPVPFILGVGHDRQPVFLNLDNAYKWLDHSALPVKAAYDFLKTNQLPIVYKVTDIRKLKGYS